MKKKLSKNNNNSIITIIYIYIGINFYVHFLFFFLFNSFKNILNILKWNFFFSGVFVEELGPCISCGGIGAPLHIVNYRGKTPASFLALGMMPTASLHTEKYFLSLNKSNRNQIVFTTLLYHLPVLKVYAIGFRFD